MIFSKRLRTLYSIEVLKEDRAIAEGDDDYCYE
jgi:hypothetical protein